MSIARQIIDELHSVAEEVDSVAKECDSVLKRMEIICDYMEASGFFRSEYDKYSHVFRRELDVYNDQLMSAFHGYSNMIKPKLEESSHNLKQLAIMFRELNRYYSLVACEMESFVSKVLSSNGSNAELVRKHYGAWIPEKPLLLSSLDKLLSE